MAALVEPKNKTMFLNFYSFLNVIEHRYPATSDAYREVYNSLFHEYIHLLNFYEDLVLYNKYIEDMDTTVYIKCSIKALIDEYVATYRSDKMLFAKNEIHKILPSMCKCISMYKGKQETSVYWDVINDLGIGIAYDKLVEEREGISEYSKDVKNCDVIEYKDLILNMRYALNEFYVSRKYEYLDALKGCAESLCGIFGMDKQFLKNIDKYLYDSNF